MRRSIGVTLLLGILTLIHVSRFGGFTADDAFITYRYAENLANGRGLTYNPPDRVEGLSNPGFALILAAGIRLGVTPELLAKVLGWLAFLALLLVLPVPPGTGSGPDGSTGPPRPGDPASPEAPDGDGAAGSAGEADPAVAGGASTHADGAFPGDGGGRIALAFQVLGAGTGSLALWAGGGLETMVYTLALWAAIRLALEDSWGAVPVALVLATLRPEGTGMAVMVCLLATRDPRRAGRRLLALVPGLAVIHGTRYAFYGAWLPNTYWAKSLALIDPVRGGASYLVAFLDDGVPSLVVVGAFLALARPRVWWVRRVGLLALVAVAPMASIGGDWMPLYRLLVPVLPLAFALAIEGGRTLRAELPLPDSWGRGLLLGLLIIGLVESARIPRDQARHIEYQNMLGRLMVEAANTLILQDGARGFDPDSRPAVALGDIGRVGYRTRWTIRDLKGLVSPGAVGGFVRDPDTGQVRPDPSWMFGRRPEWILLALDQEQHGVWAPDQECLEDPRLAALYEPVADIRVPDLPVRYRLFRRRDHTPAGPPTVTAGV